MVCIAEALSEHYNVVVEQHNREEVHEGKALYSPRGTTSHPKFTVVLRSAKVLLEARARFPKTNLYLYSHDLAGRDMGIDFKAGVFRDSKTTTNICVSNWHRSQSLEVLRAFGFDGEFKLRVIYNPLSEDVVRTPGTYNPNKLLWLASPHKGLARAYEIFEQLLTFNPDFCLYVTNPGYLTELKPNEKTASKTCILGTIPHAEVVAHLKTSLCLFYPNTVFPETFGKILAEANAVGTPVLTQRLGAASESLDCHPAQFVDCLSNEAVIKRVMAWYSGNRPVVRGNPRFKLSAVVKSWVDLLNA